MKPNQFFDIQRFGRLLAADWQLNYKRYLYILAGTFLGILAIFWLFAYQNIYFYQHNPMASRIALSNYNVAFTFCLMGLLVFITNAFPDLNGTRKSGNYLLLPASTFEKYLAQFLIYIIGGTIAFLLLFWIDTQIMHWVVLSTINNAVVNPFNFSSLFQLYPTWHNKLYAILIYFSCMTFLFTVKLFFKQLAWVKSFIAFGGLWILGVGCYRLFSYLFFGGIYQIGYQVTEQVNNMELFGFILLGLSWLFFLPLAYYKLKEKQV
jgi:hypothetical protein